MAEAIFNATPPTGWVAESAGTRPAESGNPKTGPMLREIGIEPPAHAPQLVTGEMMDRAQVLVTMGCLDDANCPARLQQLELRDWALPDPATLDDEGFREVRVTIEHRVQRLIRELGATDQVFHRSGEGT